MLLPQQTIHTVDTLVIEESLFDLISPELLPVLHVLFEKTKRQFIHHKTLSLPQPAILSELADAFRVLQGRAIAKQHGQWIHEQKPVFSPAIDARFKMALALTQAEENEALAVQARWQQVIRDNLNETRCLFLPTTPTTAPKLGEDTSELRMKILTLSAMAGLSGAAQVHLPLGVSEQNHPYGFSLLMAHGNDRSLLAKTKQIAHAFDKEAIYE